MKQDLQISELIKKEENRQLHGIELIASENFVTPQVFLLWALFLQINMRRVIPVLDIMVDVRGC